MRFEQSLWNCLKCLNFFMPVSWKTEHYLVLLVHFDKNDYGVQWKRHLTEKLTSLTVIQESHSNSISKQVKYLIHLTHPRTSEKYLYFLCHCNSSVKSLNFKIKYKLCSCSKHRDECKKVLLNKEKFRTFKFSPINIQEIISSQEFWSTDA